LCIEQFMPFTAPDTFAKKEHCEGGNNPKVLIVEDEKLLRISLQRLLVECGYDVTITNCGKTALRELSISNFQLVITDIRLPNIDGLEVAFSAKEKNPATAVILTSAQSIEQIKEKAKLVGADAFFEKPFDLQEFCNVAKQTIKNGASLKSQMTNPQ